MKSERISTVLPNKSIRLYTFVAVLLIAGISIAGIGLLKFRRFQRSPLPGGPVNQVRGPVKQVGNPTLHIETRFTTAQPEFSNPDTSQPKGCTKWIEECSSICINEKGEIPRSVFFVKLDGGFRIEEWLSVMSVVKFIKPDEITIFGAKRIQGCWWNRTQPFVKLEILPKEAWVRKLNGKKVQKLPHISDFLRTEMLYRRGGIYMDTDVIAMKSFDPLLNKQVVLADEDKAHGVPNVAVMLARQQSCFMCDFMKQACQNFDGGWITHSVDTLKRMYKRDWKHYKDALLLTLRFGFYPFSWRELHQLFEVKMDKLSFNVSQAYSIHLYHHMAKRYLKRLSDYTWISKNPSTAAHVIRSVLPEGFSKEHLDENLCIDLKMNSTRLWS